MRVFNDEPGHALVAKAMAQERIVTSFGQGRYEGGAMVYSQPSPVYRLYYYSFLVSLVHNLTGERMANLFAVNIAATFGLFVLVFRLGSVFTGKWTGGILAQLLLLGTPLLAYVAGSANYDSLNLFLLSAFILACLRYYEKGGVVLLNVAISLGILLCYCRSESILFLILLPLIFLSRSYKDRRIELSAYAAISPVFLIVPLAGSVIGKQLSDTLGLFYTDVETGFFSIIYLAENLTKFVDWFFSVRMDDLNSIVLSVLAVASLLLLPFAFVWTRRSITTLGNRSIACDLVLSALWVIIGIHLTLLLCLYWSPTEASAIRFFLPLMLISSLSIVRVAGWLDFFCNSKLSYALIALCAGYFWLFAMPKVVRGEVRYSSVPSEYTRRTLDKIKSHDDGRTLYVVKSPFYTRFHGVPAISIHKLNNNKKKLHTLLSEGLYDQIVVFDAHYLCPVSNRWRQSDPAMELDSSFITRRIDGWRGFTHAEASMSKIVGIKNSTESEDERIISLEDIQRTQAKDFDNSTDFFNYIRSLHP
jgi:hypothetical protein